MTNRTAAIRYARALIDVVVNEAERGERPSARAPQTLDGAVAVEHAGPSVEAGQPERKDTEQGAGASKVVVALQRIEQELDSFVSLFKQHATLEKVLLNPAVPVSRKRAAMAELIGRAETSPVLAKLLLLLAERDRLVLLPDLLAAYRERLLEYQKVIRAEVTTTVPLAADRAKAIERSLARVTGKTVTLATRVDPSIIGGVVARIGSTVYDGSVSRQLEKMKQKLGENA